MQPPAQLSAAAERVDPTRDDRGQGQREKQATRPRFLDLRRLSFPPGALASIAHRASGVLLALVTPFAAYAFTRSVAGPEGYAEIVDWGQRIPLRLVLTVLVAALSYHLLAGLRHLLMDAGIGTSLRIGRASAWIVLAAGVAAFVAAAAGLLR